jgi:hypothetical protein
MELYFDPIMHEGITHIACLCHDDDTDDHENDEDDDNDDAYEHDDNDNDNDDIEYQVVHHTEDRTRDHLQSLLLRPLLAASQYRRVIYGPLQPFLKWTRYPRKNQVHLDSNLRPCNAVFSFSSDGRPLETNHIIYIYIYIYVCVCVCECFQLWCVPMHSISSTDVGS